MTDSASIRIRAGQEPYMQPDRLQLRSYFPHEIDKLSAVQITQTKTFDEIGHAVRGGLYDPRLGPTEFFDKCETCHQQGTYCPGHMGYIQLEVPVFNPLLFNFTYSLMKGTCVQCHRFTCNTKGLAAKVLLVQLRALDLGMLCVAHELGSFMQEKFLDDQKSGEGGAKLSDEMAALAELDAIFTRVCGQSPSSLKGHMVRPMKNAIEFKRTLMHTFCRDHLFKHVRRCKLCGRSNGVLRNDGGRCILIDFSGAVSVKTTRAVTKASALISNDMMMEDELEEDIKDTKETKEDTKTLKDFSMSLLSEQTERILHKQMISVENGTCDKLAWRGVEVREHFRMVWKNDSALLKKLFPMFDCDDSEHCPMDVLFCEKVLVPPTKFRPIRMFKGDKFENPQTVNLRKLLEATETMRAIRMAELISVRVPGKTIQEKMHNSYLVLQQRIGAIFDQDLDKTSDQRSVIPGIKQILEKKQGLFRMNMMGKRVNHACRSVITPDPYLDVDEIGIPEVFAKKLTFVEPASVINLPKLRKLVRNGPAKHPGANFIVKPGGFKQILLDEKKDERNAAAKRLQPADTARLAYPVQVLRHLDRGDLMLMNRQPSLHKPSIMGHRVRVLKGQRALRMNYAPCKAYNADFDGDEMNGHFVQNRVAQTEVAEIANVGSNFLVPKDGTPLLGLIQDHVVSGVLLTLRGRFFNKEDFMHLVLSAFAETTRRIILPSPAMLKPQILWSGKQIISAVLLNCIPRGQPLINLTSKAKTPLSCWKVGNLPAPKFEMSESEVIFRQAELLVGVLDKQHYGSTQYGLIHCCWELYGHRCATTILSCFSRLFTTHLQYHGFTLGVADILVNKKADKQRRRVIKALRKCGDNVVRECFGLDDEASQMEIRNVLAGAYCNPRGEDQSVQQLDYRMKEKLNKFSEQINRLVFACVPTGLIRSFPQNALQMMILSGSKGTMVNSMQISCGLGQIELEGHRPPITVTGRTLPSFRAFDTSPRAGGFVDQRFLTGINPQELFFHTMAGREGLIDTAVKTSRSGYLQRCIVKHLEGLVAHYDSTVRDHDNSVVQFRYGEDGMDVCRCTFMNSKQFDFLANNLHVLRAQVVPKNALESEWNLRRSEKAYRKVKRWRKRNVNNSGKSYVGGFVDFSVEHRGVGKRELVDMWFALSAEQRAEYEKNAAKKCPDMVDEKLNPTCTLGALPEKMLDEIDAYVKKKELEGTEIPLETFRKTLFWKGLRSRCDPGENVGLLAAQSIGEPSTQMTLNTFHFAGRGEMNVTLGIPRLREILMTASTSIKTPSAEIRAKPGTSPEHIAAIKRELDRVYLKQVIKKFSVDETINLVHNDCWRRYALSIEILRVKSRDESVRHLSRRKILGEIERRFVKVIAKTINERSKEMIEYQALQHKKLKLGNMAAGIGVDGEVQKAQQPQDEGMSSDEEADAGRDADAGEVRLNQRHLDDAAEYEGEEEEQKMVAPEERLMDELAEVLDDSEAEEMDDNKEVEEESPQKASCKQEAERSRVQAVLSLSPAVCDYKYDVKSNRWCVITFQLSLSSKTKLDIASLVERELETFVVSETPGVEKCIVREENHNGQPCYVLATQGINIQANALFRHADVLDVNSLYSNDLNMILHSYGVEACARALVKEIVRVFTPYGIDVSRRHLTLTADYMTFTGQIQPFSRGAMASSSSPLQKMTFETTVAFLRDALINGEDDYLASPSARIVAGGLLRGGTGAFDLLVPGNALHKKIKEETLDE
ncbi:unnamed protein product [Toxocara canis]|uniref:DNA-directed RNA polymerase subunit n=1 Tax=Toxocara canis TaxID=6265 RepID=A0A183UF33_TOXCA|nr:unnamed protein product [Toxocara canis]